MLRPLALATSLTLALSGFAAACISGDEALPGSPPVVRRDSAGIHIVENAAPLWQGGERWQIDPVPEIVIGSTQHLDTSSSRHADDRPEPIPFERVRAIRVLSDGRIVVADNGPVEVMVFDSLGVLASRFVHRGGGPGELSSIRDVYVCQRDSIVVVSGFDMLVFDDKGNFARQARYRLGGEPTSIHAVSTNCQRVLLRQTTSKLPLDSWGLTEELFTWVDVVAQTVDTVLTASFAEGWTRKLYGSERPWVVPWGTSFTHVVTNDGLVTGYGRVAELRKHDSTGALRSVFRWSPEPQPVTRADRRRYADLRLEWLARQPEDPESLFLFPALDEYPELPSHKPLFDQILVDDGGSLWVRDFPEGSYGLFDSRLPEQTWSNQTWTVFDSAGAWLGDLTLPDRFELRAVARGRVYGVARDSLDVETVQIFKIQGHSPAPR